MYDLLELTIAKADRGRFWRAPYKDLLTIYAQGNHETNVRRRQHTDPSARLVHGLKQMGSPIELGGYSGWVRWQYQRYNEKRSWLMHYHHGYGGNAPRSKGVLSADIDTAKFPDADIILRGHDHQKWHLPMSAERMSRQMRRQERAIHHLRCGSYKMLGDGYKGWETEKGFARPRLGGWWWWCEASAHKDWATGIIEAC